MKTNNKRQLKVADTIKEAMASILLNERPHANDAIIDNAFITISNVEMSPCLKHAKIFISLHLNEDTIKIANTINNHTKQVENPINVNNKQEDEANNTSKINATSNFLLNEDNKNFNNIDVTNNNENEIMNKPEKKISQHSKRLLDFLNGHLSYFRYKLANSVNLKFAPNVYFHLDMSYEFTTRIEQLLEKTK